MPSLLLPLLVARVAGPGVPVEKGKFTGFCALHVRGVHGGLLLRPPPAQKGLYQVLEVGVVEALHNGAVQRIGEEDAPGGHDW